MVKSHRKHGEQWFSFVFRLWLILAFHLQAICKDLGFKLLVSIEISEKNSAFELCPLGAALI